MQEKYGFVYIWYDRKRKMYYIGCHWGTENDGYICSSNRMRDAYKRRPEDFKRRILKSNIIEKRKLLDEEYYWLQMIDKELLGKKYYNYRVVKIGAITEFLSEKHKIKISKSNLGKKRSEEFKKNKSILMKEKWKDPTYRNNMIQKHKGKKHSDNTKNKMKENSKGMSGKNHSEETKIKIGIANKGKPSWNRGKKLSEQTRQKMRNSKIQRFSNTVDL